MKKNALTLEELKNRVIRAHNEVIREQIHYLNRSFCEDQNDTPAASERRKKEVDRTIDWIVKLEQRHSELLEYLDTQWKVLDK